VGDQTVYDHGAVVSTVCGSSSWAFLTNLTIEKASDLSESLLAVSSSEEGKIGLEGGLDLLSLLDNSAAKSAI